MLTEPLVRNALSHTIDHTDSETSTVVRIATKILNSSLAHVYSMIHENSDAIKELPQTKLVKDFAKLTMTIGDIPIYGKSEITQSKLPATFVFKHKPNNGAVGLDEFNYSSSVTDERLFFQNEEVRSLFKSCLGTSKGFGISRLGKQDAQYLFTYIEDVSDDATSIIIKKIHPQTNFVPAGELYFIYPRITNIEHLGNVGGGDTTGQFLKYDTSDEIWEQHVLKVSDLTDVTGTPSTGDSIVYNGTGFTYAKQTLENIEDPSSSASHKPILTNGTGGFMLGNEDLAKFLDAYDSGPSNAPSTSYLTFLGKNTSGNWVENITPYIQSVASVPTQVGCFVMNTSSTSWTNSRWRFPDAGSTPSSTGFDGHTQAPLIIDTTGIITHGFVSASNTEEFKDMPAQSFEGYVNVLGKTSAGGATVVSSTTIKTGAGTSLTGTEKLIYNNADKVWMPIKEGYLCLGHYYASSITLSSMGTTGLAGLSAGDTFHGSINQAGHYVTFGTSPILSFTVATAGNADKVLLDVSLHLSIYITAGSIDDLQLIYNRSLVITPPTSFTTLIAGASYVRDTAEVVSPFVERATDDFTGHFIGTLRIPSGNTTAGFYLRNTGGSVTFNYSYIIKAKEIILSF